MTANTNPKKSAGSKAGREMDEQQLVCFRLADEEFGVDINTVREIVRVPEITYIPRAPAYVRGIANLRGNVLPIIDGRLRLTLPEAEVTERTRALILDINGLSTGMVVDAVSEVKRIAMADVDPPPAVTQGGVDSSFLSGVVKLDQGKRLIMTLRPENVLNQDMAETEAGGPQSLHTAMTGEENQIQKTADISERQFVSFVVGEEEYAFDINVVKEILRLTEITAVPNAPMHVRGLLTVRNVLLPILDLRTLLGMPEDDSEDQRVLVVEVQGLSVGLLVDKVNEVVRVPISVIDETPRLASSGQELAAVARLDEGKRLILIMNEHGLIDVDEVSDLVADDEEAGEAAAVDTAETEERQLVTFQLGQEEYGFAITQVQEINRLGELTRLPKAPSFVAGVTNLRGQVVPLINLRRRFNLEERPADDRTRIIIVDLEGHRTGIIVDQVNEVLRLSARDIDPTPQILSSDDLDEQAGFMAGVCKVDKGNRMILLLDTAKLLSSREQKTLETVGGKPASSGKTTRAKPKPAAKPKKNQKSAKKSAPGMQIDE